MADVPCGAVRPRLLLALLVAGLAVPALASPAGAPATQRTLTVAVSANLQTVLPELVGAFERRTPGVKVEATYGSTGGLATRIQAGEPFDIFLGADRAAAARLAGAGLARGEPFPYATGKLALWVAMSIPVNPHARGVAVLSNPAIRRFALGDPAMSPYGAAAEEVLRSLGLLDAVRGKMVPAESILQVVELARAGKVDAAFIPWPVALVPPLGAQGRFIAVPPGSHAPIVQHGVVLAAAKDGALAAEFVAFLTGPVGRTILERYKYSFPSG